MEVFFHRTALRYPSDFDTLREKETRVDFELGHSDKGPRAEQGSMILAD